MRVVCLDTHVLIWGLKEEAHPKCEEMISKAKRFLEYLDEEKVVTIIPVVVLAELLMGTPPDQHDWLIQEIEDRFSIQPFGKIEARIFGKLWQDKNDDGTVEKIKEDLKSKGISARSKIKADLMIVATAVAWRAEKIISYDSDLKSLAEGLIAVESIPDLPKQEQLFR